MDPDRTTVVLCLCLIKQIKIVAGNWIALNGLPDSGSLRVGVTEDSVDVCRHYFTIATTDAANTSSIEETLPQATMFELDVDSRAISAGGAVIFGEPRYVMGYEPVTQGPSWNLFSAWFNEELGDAPDPELIFRGLAMMPPAAPKGFGDPGGPLL